MVRVPIGCETDGRFLYSLLIDYYYARLVVKPDGLFCIMNWTDKANEIADKTINSIEDGLGRNYTKEDVINALRNAALEGMKWECENWVRTRQ